jgi:LysM repeat protein
VARVAEAASTSSSSDARVADANTGRRVTDAEPAAPAPVVVKPKYHTVRSGDTLSGIAARYKVSVSQVKTWNKLRSDRITTGQKLKVSLGSTAPASTASKEAVAPKETTASKEAAAPKEATASKDSLQKMRYTVKRGDSLSGIASKHRVSVAEIQKWNKLGRSTSIQSGQVLTLYVDTPDWSQYTVKSGDTLTEIAAKLGCSVTDLKEWNRLDSSAIQVGQVLKVKK